MANCNSCPKDGECTDKKNCTIEHNTYSKINRIIGVMSGKGGVGKSTLAVLLAKELATRGLRVGIMDADITGPSIPRLMGISTKKAAQNELGLLPILSNEEISVISINALLDEESRPVIWRGPIISNTIKQFYKDVFWGELDYLIIDLPPGTSDAALTVMQSIPINGMLIVGVAQDMVSMIVQKAVNMIQEMGIKILGLVENFSYVKCPDCGKKIELFHRDRDSEFLKETDIKQLGCLPVSEDISHLNETGIELCDDTVKKTIKEITDSVIANTMKKKEAK